MSGHAISLYPVLFETLSNNSDEVVIQGLTVLAEIVNCTNKSKGTLHTCSVTKQFPTEKKNNLNDILQPFFQQISNKIPKLATPTTRNF